MVFQIIAGGQGVVRRGPASHSTTDRIVATDGGYFIAEKIARFDFEQVLRANHSPQTQPATLARTFPGQNS